MKKTKNYGLNQWDETDRILREDFNTDNAKIDAALLQNPIVKLREIVTTSNASQVDIDISDFDWNTFRRLLILTDMSCTGSECVNTRIRFNRLESKDYLYRGVGDSYADSATFIGYIPMSNGTNRYNTDLEVTGDKWCARPYCKYTTRGDVGGGSGIGPQVAVGQLKTINIFSTNTTVYISSGSKFILYGVKI